MHRCAGPGERLGGSEINSCPFKRPRLGSQHPCDCLRPHVTPVPDDPLLSSGLHGHRRHGVHRYTCRQTHKGKNKGRKKSRNKYVRYDHKLNICIKWLEGKIVWIILIVYKEHRQLLKTIEISSITIQLPLKANWALTLLESILSSNFLLPRESSTFWSYPVTRRSRSLRFSSRQRSEKVSSVELDNRASWARLYNSAPLIRNTWNNLSVICSMGP